MTTPLTAKSTDLTHLLNEREVADRLGTSVDSVRWMRRKRRIRFIRIAGNRKVRFWWPHVMEDLSLLTLLGVSGGNNKAGESK
ncbi:MAG: hypothetical protein WCO94_16635 [Verrucomicrobiota bacterium]